MLSIGICWVLEIVLCQSLGCTWEVKGCSRHFLSFSCATSIVKTGIYGHQVKSVYISLYMHNVVLDGLAHNADKMLI